MKKFQNSRSSRRRRTILTLLTAAVCGAFVSHFAAPDFNVLPQADAAERKPLIDDWKFRRGDADEPAWRLTWRNVEPYALATRAELTAPETRGVKPGAGPALLIESIREDYDDSAWETVDLPFDAAIHEPFSYANEPTQSLLPTSGPLWFRKTFDLPAESTGKTIALDFDGVMSRGAVWINGKFAGGWGYGYTSFRVDATPFVKFGAKNVVVVRSNNPPQSSRWYTGAGIYRNVWLVEANPVRAARWGVFVRTNSVDAAAKTAKTSVSVDVENAAANANNKAKFANAPSVDATVSVEFFRRDADGKKIGEPFAKLGEKTVSVAPGKVATADFNDVEIANAPLWSPDDPQTCLAVSTISVDGKVVDVDETPFGIRQLEYDANRGVLINGKLYELNGFCLHHDFGALGAAYNIQALERRLNALKSIGCNAIRLSHNPSAPETVDLLARRGFLVQAEAFDQWRRPQGGSWRAAGYLDLFDNWSEADLRSLVRRDRNSPAIIMWSVGNEIPELSDPPEFVRQAKRLVQIVAEEDPTRPATAACNDGPSGFGEIPNVVGVFGYNYYGRGAYAKFHEKNPTVPVYGSETVCAITTRGWYTFPYSKTLKDGLSDFRHSSYGWSAPHFNPEKPLSGWACPPDVEFEAQDRNPFVLGDFGWTGVDYLGAPFYIDEMAVSQKFVDGEREAAANADRERFGAARVPLRICETGVFDSALFPKDLAYLYKSRFLPNEKTLHILPHWNFPNRVGEKTPVVVFTSGDSVELFLNGKSLGRKTKGEFEYRLAWEDVVYEPGTLRAVAYKNGSDEVWAETTVETTGAPAALRLKTDESKIAADGRALSFATLEVVDAKGRVVPDAEIDVEFQLDGPGTLVATDSGNGCDLTIYSSPKRRTFAGLSSAIVRSKRGEPGTLRLTATADGLTAATLEIAVESK